MPTNVRYACEHHGLLLIREQRSDKVISSMAFHCRCLLVKIAHAAMDFWTFHCCGLEKHAATWALRHSGRSGSRPYTCTNGIRDVLEVICQQCQRHGSVEGAPAMNHPITNEDLHGQAF